MSRRYDDLGPPQQLPAQPQARAQAKLPPTPEEIESIQNQYVSRRAQREERSFFSKLMFWKSEESEDRYPEDRSLLNHTEDDGVTCKCSLTDFFMWTISTGMSAAGGSALIYAHIINNDQLKDVKETHLVGAGQAIGYALLACGACVGVCTCVKKQCFDKRKTY